MAEMASLRVLLTGSFPDLQTAAAESKGKDINPTKITQQIHMR